MSTDTSQTFDLVITGGRVIDPETKLDAVRNVGINGGTIVVVTEDEIAGKESIDASGHVVAPGFIDMHQHLAAIPFGQKLALRDGVTTPMELEVGAHPVKDWYDGLKGKSQTNYGASSGLMPARELTFNPKYETVYEGDFVYDLVAATAKSHATMKWSTQVATPDELKVIATKVEDGIKDGAIGVGHPVGYMVDGCSQNESIIAQKLAGQYGQAVFTHGRYSSQEPPTGGILGFLEMMGPQSVYGGGLVFHHMTAQALNDTPAALQLFDDARAKGINVIAEVYPYDYGASIVAADYLHPDNYQKNMARSYKDIIEIATMKPLTKDRYDELVKTAPATPIMFMNATEATVQHALAHPSTVVGSDAFAYTIAKTGESAIDWDTPFDAVDGHPRAAGTHALFLKWVREKTVDIPLSLAVSKMTYMIAAFMEDNGAPQMARKGRIQNGADADVTVFDPATVTDNATMQKGGLPSTGIPYVVVNGTIVVKDSEVLKGVCPGQPVWGSAKTA